MGRWPFSRGNDDSGDDNSSRYAPRVNPDPPKPLRWYEIRLKDGTTERVEAHFAFDNSDDGRGLVFRRIVPDEDKTMIAMQYANGSWISFREVR